MYSMCLPFIMNVPGIPQLNYDRHVYNLTSDSMREVAAAPKWSENCATSSPAEIMYHLTTIFSSSTCIFIMWKCTNSIQEGGGGGFVDGVDAGDVIQHDAMSRQWDKIRICMYMNNLRACF